MLKKLLVVVDSLQVGGAEYDIVRNYPLLNKINFNIKVITLRDVGPLSAKLRQNGIRVDSLEERLPNWLLSLGRLPIIGKWLEFALTPIIYTLLTMYLAKYIKRYKIDIVHTYLTRSYFIAGLVYILSFKKFKLINSRLGLSENLRRNLFTSYYERRFLHKFCTKIIANSNAVINDLIVEGVSPKKIELVYNGIDTASFKRYTAAPPAKVVEITAVGNLHAYKGYADLIQAIKLLVERGVHNFHVSIAGKDIDANLTQYLAFIEQHNLGSYVKFVGLYKDVRVLLQKSMMQVHPSHTEGLGSAIIEAMAARLPVIAYNVGGIPELIDNEHEGFLVEAFNIEEFANAMQTLIQNPDLCHIMGEKAEIKAQLNFDVHSSSSNLGKIYTELAN